MSSGQALRCSSGVGAKLAEGVFQFPALGDDRSSPLLIPREVVAERVWDPLVADLKAEPLSKLELSAVEDSVCVVMTLNCGSLTGKVPRLVALMTVVEPDVVCVQETWAGFDASELAGLPYAAFTGPKFDGGGLMTLVHRRLSLIHI